MTPHESNSQIKITNTYFTHLKPQKSRLNICLKTGLHLLDTRVGSTPAIKYNTFIYERNEYFGSVLA